MSLKTKLLAVFLGLNGAILLLALALYLLAEAGTPFAAVDRILHVVHAEPRVSAVARVLEAESRAGRVGDVWVVREEGQDLDGPPAEHWTLDAFLASEEPGALPPDVTNPAEVRRLSELLKRARPQSFLIREDYLAVHAPPPGGRLRGYAFVVALHNPRAGVRAVYWVLIGGILVLAVVSFLAVQRLVVVPLGQLARTAERIAEGDYRVEPPTGPVSDEIDRTLSALVHMAREISEYQGHLEDRVLSALTRIKKAEQHLAIAQRLAATGKLAAGLAHEINNPLGGMKNAVRALARGDLDVSRTAVYLDLVENGLSRIEQTVKKFLSFTPRRVEPVAVDLRDVADKSVELARHRIDPRGIEVERDLAPPGTAVVFGDPHELQQVALNLVLNAADAIDEGRGDGRIRVEVERSGEEVVLRVRDNGQGMTPEAQDHCFDMFFTTKAEGEGSGMGLAVVHNVVTNHGGRIDFTTRAGEGTTFEVVLPAEGPPAPGPSSAEEGGEEATRPAQARTPPGGPAS
jgi:signal transduction histidine kinase